MRRFPPWAPLWFIATVVGYLFAGLGTHFPGSFPVGSGVLVAVDPGAAIFGLVIGGVGGLVIGTLQWLVLRSWVGMTWRWLAATALAVSVTHGLGDGLPSSVGWTPLAFAGAGVMVGALWVALAGRADRELLASAGAASFGIGVALGVAIADPESPDWMAAHLVAGAIAGTVVALGTGAALTRSQSRNRVAPSTL